MKLEEIKARYDYDYPHWQGELLILDDFRAVPPMCQGEHDKILAHAREDIPALIAEVERLQGELIGRDIAFRETLKECKEVGFTDPALINIQAESRKKLAAIRKAAEPIMKFKEAMQLLKMYNGWALYPPGSIVTLSINDFCALAKAIKEEK